MDPRLWKTAQEIFHAAADVPADGRDAYLDRACGGDPALREIVDRLLSGDQSAPEWLDRGADDASEILDSGATESLPERIGPYRVLGVLGSGGMGTVYEGERQDDFSMRVALKSVRPGAVSTELLRRFHRERQILAHLQHPAIARLLDGGEGPDGRPWFAMEYVDGEPIDEWCDGRKLDVRGRVRLFLSVCRAVEYAHGNLVLHRDLKPSNVLVTDSGEPKLLDFGIARLLEPDMDPGLTRDPSRQPLTPEYASPEQFREEPLTTASDVYQLGLMLYRLLTGRVPHPPGMRDRELARWRTERQPTWPSATVLHTPGGAGEGPPPSANEMASLRGLTPERLSRQLKGDLDLIVLKALRPEPGERYPSVASLADDLERHLDSRPVHARPPSLAYHAGRFIRRHRVAVVGATVALVAVLGAAGVAVQQARVATQERDLASEASAFLEDLLTAPDPFQGGLGPADSIRMVDFIDYADDRIRNGLADRPRTRARMLTLLGRVHMNLGNGERSVAALRDAVEANRSTFGPDAQETVEALRSLGFSLSETGAGEEAEATLQEALRGQVALTGAESLPAASIQELLARRFLDARRLDDAEPLLRASYETRRSLLGETDPALLGALNGLAALSSFRQDEEGALVWMERAVQVLEEAGPDERANLGITLGNLGGVYRRLGRVDEADATLTRGVTILQEMLGPDHFLTAGAQASLAAVRAYLERYGEADSLWSTAVRTLEAASPGNLALAGEQGAWARSLRQRGRLDEAESRARAAVDASRRIGGPTHPLLAINTALLADILRDGGRLAEADQAYGQAIDILSGAPPGPNVLAIRISQASVWEEMGRHAEAESALRSLHATAESSLGRGHPVERRAAAALVALYERAGRGDEAEPFR
jgi:serine/threonine protein kinase/tetratricopeptide (TPR) repeat protein